MIGATTLSITISGSRGSRRAAARMRDDRDVEAGPIRAQIARGRGQNRHNPGEEVPAWPRPGSSRTSGTAMSAPPQRADRPGRMRGAGRYGMETVRHRHRRRKNAAGKSAAVVLSSEIPPPIQTCQEMNPDPASPIPGRIEKCSPAGRPIGRKFCTDWSVRVSSDSRTARSGSRPSDKKSISGEVETGFPPEKCDNRTKGISGKKSLGARSKNRFRGGGADCPEAGPDKVPRCAQISSCVSAQREAGSKTVRLGSGIARLFGPAGAPLFSVGAADRCPARQGRGFGRWVAAPLWAWMIEGSPGPGAAAFAAGCERPWFPRRAAQIVTFGGPTSLVPRRVREAVTNL